MSNLKPLRKLEPWMQTKVDQGRGIYAQDGNGCYFLDFETLKFYSPFDDELDSEEDRQLEYRDGELYCKLDGESLGNDIIRQEYFSYLAEKELLI